MPPTDGQPTSAGRMYRDGAFANLSLPAEDATGRDDLGYWAEDHSFVACVRTGRPLAPAATTLQDAIVTMELVDAFLSGW